MRSDAAPNGVNMSCQPNVLFFFTDDQRFDTVRALGNDAIQTPTMDSFARHGTSFTRASIMGGTSGAVCMPSRAMLMSGRTLFHIYEQGQDIPPEHLTMPEAFRRAGYRTFGTGKWHNGIHSYARSFTDGADIYFGGMNDHWNVPAADFDPSGAYPQDQRTRRPGIHSSELFSQAAIDFLESYDDEAPFYMYISYMAPHDPRTMPQKYRDMYDPAEIELPPNFIPVHPFDNGELVIRDENLAGRPRTKDEIRRHIADYYAMITHADAEMGRVVDCLREQGLAQDTIVVFAGDNGLAVGRHGLMGKQNLYDHSVRVPLIFSGPGVPADVRSQAHAYLIDIYPTLCDLCDLEVPGTVEGLSLCPAMGDPDERIREALLYAYRHLQRGVREDRYKLIEYVVDGRRKTQLFDVIDDPWEMRDMAQDPDHADDVARLRKELQRWRTDLDDPCNAFWEAFDCA
jgi:arylsulfatase A-like enzyme